MGGTRELPTLLSHASTTYPPSSPRMQNTADPALAPSFLTQKLPESSSPGPTSGHGPLQPPAPTTAGGILPGESQSVPKLSDSGGSSSENLLRQDSLVESNSDWSDESDDNAKRGLAVGSLATGLCYDPRMRYHCEVNPTSDVHPEDPRRIYYIYKALCKAGLVDDEMANRLRAAQPLQRINARPGTEAEITLIHTEAHYAFVKSTKRTHILSLYIRKRRHTDILSVRNGRP